MRKTNGKMKKSIAIIVSMVLIISLSQFVFAARLGHVYIDPREDPQYGPSFRNSTTMQYLMYARCKGYNGNNVEVRVQKFINYYVGWIDYSSGYICYAGHELNRTVSLPKGIYRLKLSQYGLGQAEAMASMGY